MKVVFVARSLGGSPVASFDDEVKARAWKRDRPRHKVRLFKVVTMEEELSDA